MFQARRQLDIKYMKMKQKVGGLRERDMELARTLETKMNTYQDMLEELGIQYKLPEVSTIPSQD